MAACSKMKVNSCPSPYTKISSRQTKEFNIRQGTLKLREEKAGNRLELVVTRKDFLNRTPIIWALKSTINSRHLMKPKSFCSCKGQTHSNKMGSTHNRKRSLPIMYLTEDQFLEYVKNEKLAIKKTNKLISKWGIELSRVVQRLNTNG